MVRTPSDSRCVPLDFSAARLPSEKVLDTPLSPPHLSDEPGPAAWLSGDYPDGTHIRWSGPVLRTQHATSLRSSLPARLPARPGIAVCGRPAVRRPYRL